MNKLYEENAVQDIANAIREKNGLATLYKIGEMGQAIREIKTGASGLNVIRSVTKPASAAENTVWLETDVQDGALFVSSVEPASPVDGDVWVVPRNASPLELPIFEGINLSMGVARLRAADAWCFIDFAVFVNNVWKDTHTPLFKDGAWGGVLTNGTATASSWSGSDNNIGASVSIAGNTLVMSGRSLSTSKGSGFTGAGTRTYLEMSSYYWQSATFALTNASDVYFGLYWENKNGGVYKLQGEHILATSATSPSTFRVDRDYIGPARPAILVRETSGTAKQLTLHITDWFLV